MSGGNVIITSTKNVVTFEVDKGSYAKAKKQVQQIGKEWDKVGAKMAKATNGTRPTGSGRFQGNGRRGGRGGNPANNPSNSGGSTGGSRPPRQTPEQKAAAKAAKRAEIETRKREMKTQQIRAKSIRFNTAASAYNLTGKQRTESLQQFGDLTRQFHKGSIAVGEYNAAVSRLQTNMRRQGRVGMKGQTLPVTAKVTKLDTSLIESAKGAIVIGATVALGKSVMTAGQDLQSVESGLTAVTGSSEAAAKEMQYLRDQANRLGLDLIKTSRDYMKFSASTKGSMDSATTKNIFEGLSEYSTVLGLTADQSSLALNALSQMSAKSVVSMEELRQQLGDHIPGAMAVFTKAYNKVNDTKLTEGEFASLVGDGKVLASKILPQVGKEFQSLARTGGALDKAVNSNRASYQRLQTAMQASMGAFFDGGFGSALTNTFDTMSAALNNNADTFKFWGNIAGNIIDGATDSFALLYDTIVLLTRVGGHYLEEMGVTFESMEGWGSMAAYALGVTAFAGSMWKLGGAVKWIIGFLNPLTKMLGVMQAISALGGIEAATSGGVAGKKGPKGTKGTPAATKPGVLGRVGKGALIGGAGLVGAAATNPYTYPVALGAYAAVSTDNATREMDGLGLIDSIAARWNAGGWSNFEANKLAANGQGFNADNVGYYGRQASPTMNTFKIPQLDVRIQQPDKASLDVNVNVNDGQIKDLVNAAVVENNGFNFNLLTGGGD